MTAALSAVGLGRRYGKTWALRDCTFEVPHGSVSALIGPNGAGKTTLLEIAVGILEPTAGEMFVLGEPTHDDVRARLRRMGFVAQETPLYRNFSVLEMLRFGRHMNTRWDDDLARDRLRRLRIPLDRLCGQLSGGQQAQVALTLAVAKRPEMLFLDEPVARLDPLARREFLESLMEIVAEGDVTVILSSHLIADLERVSDHVVLLVEGRVLLAGSTEALLADHRVVSGPRDLLVHLSERIAVIDASVTARQATLMMRGDVPLLHPAVSEEGIGMEELVLAYLRQRPLPEVNDRILAGALP